MSRQLDAVKMLFIVSCFLGSFALSQPNADQVMRPSLVHDKCKQQACGQHVVVAGWLLARFEFAALYDDSGQPSSNEYDKCLGVLLPENVRQQLEQYNHRYVVATGTLDGLSAANTCGAVYLTVQSVEVNRGESSSNTIETVLDSERVRSNPKLAGAEQLRVGARRLVRAFASGNMSTIKSITAPQLWRRIEVQARDPRSRLRYLLSNKNNLFGVAINQRKPKIDLIQFVDDNDSAVACVCKKATCDTRRATMETKSQSFADPYFCFSNTIEDGRWYITDTVFVESL